ncbi:MAG: hypothetical protein Q9160_004256 [Pyrenula sp. 1 TL-2023]
MDYANYYYNLYVPEEDRIAENRQNNGLASHQNNSFAGSQDNSFAGVPNNSFSGSQANLFAGPPHGYAISRDNSFAAPAHHSYAVPQNSSFAPPPNYSYGGTPSHGYATPYPNSSYVPSQVNHYGAHRNSGYDAHRNHSNGGQQSNSYDNHLDPALYSTGYQNNSGILAHDNSYWAPSQNAYTYWKPMQDVSNIPLPKCRDSLMLTRQQVDRYVKLQPQEVVPAHKNPYSDQYSNLFPVPAPDAVAHNFPPHRQPSWNPIANENPITPGPARQKHRSMPSQSSGLITSSSGLGYLGTSSDHEDTVLPSKNPTRTSERIQTQQRPSYSEITPHRTSKKTIQKKPVRRIQTAKKMPAKIKQLLNDEATGSIRPNRRWTRRIGDQKKKIFDGFRLPTDPIPVGWETIPLEELCYFYPNNLFGHVLRRFINHEPKLWDQWIVRHMHPHARAQLSPSGANFLRKYLEREEIIMMEEARGAPPKLSGITTQLMPHPPPGWFIPQKPIKDHLKAQEERKAENERKLAAKHAEEEAGKSSDEEEIGNEAVVKTSEEEKIGDEVAVKPMEEETGDDTIVQSIEVEDKKSPGSLTWADIDLDDQDAVDAYIATLPPEEYYVDTSELESDGSFPRSDGEWDSLRADFEAKHEA